MPSTGSLTITTHNKCDFYNRENIRRTKNINFKNGKNFSYKPKKNRMYRGK